jgi:hypothetical protein
MSKRNKDDYKHPSIDGGESTGLVRAADIDFAKWRKRPEVQKQVKKHARTSRLSLARRRLALEETARYMNELMNRAKDEKDPGTVAEFINMISLMGTCGCMDVLCLNFDALAIAQEGKYLSADGEMKEGEKRFSVAETMIDLHDMLMTLIQLMTVQVRQTNEDIFQRLKRIPHAEGGWQDENDVPVNPYYARIQEIVAGEEDDEEENGPKPELTDEEKKKAMPTFKADEVVDVRTEATAINYEALREFAEGRLKKDVENGSQGDEADRAGTGGDAVNGSTEDCEQGKGTSGGGAESES